MTDNATPKQFDPRPLFAALVVLLGSTAWAADAPPTFNRDIRPILSDACFQCHGPDARQRQGNLRLDVRDQALAPAESGARALVPGKPDNSELLRRLTSTDPDVRMPPPNSGKQVSAVQVETLKKWIASGATYEGHWAFLPPVRPTLPDITTPRDARNPVDRFVVARLERERLRPAPAADRETLIRRVTLDLTGLPPTAEEINDYLNDGSAAAYERLVDRLLASPRYGERMALNWLDFARYADSNGYQVDSSRQMWPWRDWVVNAFNRNLPFDQFTIEQLAGDLLPNATRAQQVATGFHRNHRLNGEGGIIAEEWRVETVIDRVETTGLTWLGLTLNCCRCHDHKYDPITQKEFYQLFAFFNNVPESGTLGGESRNTDPVLPVPTAAQEQELEQLDTSVRRAEEKVAHELKRLPELVAAWEPGFRQRLEREVQAWAGLRPTAVKSQGGAVLTRQDDGSYLASGPNPANDVYEIVAPLAAGSFTGLLLEVFPDSSLPNQSLGRYPNGNFVLSGVEAEIRGAGLAEPLRAKFVKAEADYSQPNYEIQLVVAPNRQRGWAVDGNDPAKRLPRRAMFLVDAPLTVPADATVTVRLRHEALGQHNIGRFRLSATGMSLGAISLQGVRIPDSLRQALHVPLAERAPAQKAEVESYFRANEDSPIRRAEVEVRELQAKRGEFEKAFPNVMVMKELDKPRDAFFLIRGQYDKRGDKVGLGLPAVFPPLPAGAPLNRLGLAQWIVSPDHPLTARVWVNRAWEKFFGTGLVKTSENLGSQSDFPSHPDLIDWLACEFRAPASASPKSDGSRDETSPAWDMKAFQRLLVTSATYRQSARVTPDLAQRDPDNRLLARGPRFRLPAELIRDQALAVSGVLTSHLGGPSVRPYMPNGVWDETSRYGDLRNYKHDTQEGLYRRSLYTIWKRTAAPPSMLLFDAPNREICTVKRSRTNTPLQALSLMNEVTYVEAARQLGQRMMTSGGASPAERIAYGFRLATGRQPADEELRVLVDGWQQDRERFVQAADAARQVVAFGDLKPLGTLDPVELAAYTLAANVLLNLDEVVTRE